MQSTPKKPCKYCRELESNHWPYQCSNNPKKKARSLKRTPIRRIGKKTKKWLALRREWLRKHPDTEFKCFYCPTIVPRSEVTLDHYRSRSRHPELVFDEDNLVPSCAPCNREKGSIDGDDFKKV